MARRNPPSSKKSLPNPNDKGLSTNLGDKIEEAVFDILNQPSASQSSASQPQPRQRRVASSNLQISNNNSNNCCNCCNDMLGLLYIINQSTSKILNALKAEHLLDKKKADQLRKDKENKERREKENFMETTGRKMSRTMSTLVAPIRSAIDAILRFILFTIAGRAVNKILKWFADPANKRKVESLTRFLKDWWPAILGAFVLFGTRFGASIRGMVGAVIKTILHLKKIGIPGIVKNLKNPFVVGGALLAGGATALALNYLGSDDKDKKNQQDTQDQNTPTPSKPSMPAYASGGLIRGLNFLLPEERHISEIGFAEGGHIDDDTGLRITGAGPDTQLIAAQPGEVVMSKAAVQKYGADTFLRMNMMAGSNNQPRFVNNIQLAKDGGMVGGMMQGIKNFGSNVMQNMMPSFNKPAKAINYSRPTGPKISASDYNALLAIAAAEDADPQGRADVAQSIYNRLLAGSQYGLNFMPTGGKNTIKDIITGSGQYQPTFNNRQDWLNISDRNSAARALANAKKIDMNAALRMLSDTESALKNSGLQMNAQRHVGGRPSFFGTSEHGSMKGDDVLRYDMINGKRVNRRDNFFTHYPAEDSTYRKERGNVAAPIPIQLQVPQLQSQIPRPRSSAGQISFVELPPIDMRKAAAQSGATASSDVPDFSAIHPYSDRYGESGKLNQLGIIV